MINSYIFYALAGLLVIAILLYMYKIRKEKNEGTEGPMEANNNLDEDYIREMVMRYGEPENVISVSCLTSPKQSMPVLFYSDGLVAGGSKIPRENILDVTFNNSANPYMVNNYQVIITTDLPDNGLIHITVGNDIDLAKKLMQAIQEFCRK